MHACQYIWPRRPQHLAAFQPAGWCPLIQRWRADICRHVARCTAGLALTRCRESSDGSCELSRRACSDLCDFSAPKTPDLPCTVIVASCAPGHALSDCWMCAQSTGARSSLWAESTSRSWSSVGTALATGTVRQACPPAQRCLLVQKLTRSVSTDNIILQARLLPRSAVCVLMTAPYALSLACCAAGQERLGRPAAGRRHAAALWRGEQLPGRQCSHAPALPPHRHVQGAPTSACAPDKSAQ